jgi:hypothetical protein
MFKKIFKAAKDLVRSPAGQLGIGLLIPGAGGFLQGVKGAGTMANLARGIGTFAVNNPMLTQAGIGLLGGDKPANVLRNVAYGTALGGIRNLNEPSGFMGGVQQSLGMNPAIANQVDVGGSSAMSRPTMGQAGVEATQEVAKPGVLKSITDSLINENETDFFKKYSPLLKIGAVGASVLASMLSEEEQRLLYDPNKNPYLASGSADTDFFRDINPYYAATMNQGGVMDFPEKEGMINGPGDGQSDDIPAMLSDGEFVMTKQAVMAAGNGDRDEGTKQMYSMMNNLEERAENMGIGRV